MLICLKVLEVQILFQGTVYILLKNENIKEKQKSPTIFNSLSIYLSLLVFQQSFIPTKYGVCDPARCSSPSLVLQLSYSWKSHYQPINAPGCAAGEEAGNALHSRAALYPTGDNGRRAERQAWASGHVPHWHINLSGQEAAFPVTLSSLYSCYVIVYS